jgi:signal transduction histidine kinase/DNA-binding response OmpR family regulator
MNRAYKYVKEALSPGGTLPRYKVWSAITLLIQLLTCILPAIIQRPGSIWGQVVFYSLIAVSILAMFPFQPKTDKLVIRILSLIGMSLVGWAVIFDQGNIGIIQYLLTWATLRLVGERRGYFTFMHLVLSVMYIMLMLFLSLQFASPGSYPLFHRTFSLTSASLLILINSYLVYIDVDKDTNFYEDAREIYRNLETLSKEITVIFSKEGELNFILDEISQKCIPLLKMEDCVIYLHDPDKDKLIQVSAYGYKKNEQRQIVQPLEISPGKGVVGKCFMSGEPLLVPETAYFEDYIVDGEAKRSELAVPIHSEGKVVGVIDSEHSLKGFFNEKHLQSFLMIASFCGIKITEYNARRSILAAHEAQQEAEHYRELDELKNKFIANISHDLKTPLSLIKAPASQISQIAENNQIKDLSNYILKNTEHLVKVVDQLLQLNRIDHGLKQLYLEEVELSKLLAKIGQQYQGITEQKNIKLDIDSMQQMMVTDSFKLEQVIHNLVHNALRYGGKNGIIQMKAIIVDKQVVITVTDNGPGIPLEFQDRVFERFFKVDVNNHEGTGIGLSLVKEYVQALAGKINLTSIPGKGTKFTIVLPIAHPDAEEIEPVQQAWELAENDMEAKPIMMIVEDHADLNRFIGNYFEGQFNCVSAFNGKEAFEKVMNQVPDIIITDLMMSEGSGETLVQQIRNTDSTSHIPVIVLSAKTQTKSKINLYEIGADNYLQKPFDIGELQAIVNNVLLSRKRLRDKFRENYIVPSNENQVTHLLETSDNPFIEEAIQFVLAHLDDTEVSVSKMAQELGMGRNKLQKDMKELTGLTPVEFIRSIRLNEAKNKLLNKKLTVSEVAFSVGFSNLSYFTRSFKAEFGVLPSEWQETNLMIPKLPSNPEG